MPNDAPSSTQTALAYLRGTAGAAAGVVVGYFVFQWMLGQGFYALMLPGTLLGLGFGWSSGRKLWPGAVACGIAALAAGVLTEWRFSPFVKDESLGYFIRHIFDLRPATLLLIVVGGLLAGWFGLGRDRQSTPR